MHGPRDLLARLCRCLTVGLRYWKTVVARLYRCLQLYLPVAGVMTVLIADHYTLFVREIGNPVVSSLNQVLLQFTQPMTLVLNDAAMATFSAMDTLAVLAAYSVYVSIDAVLQVIQSGPPLPSGDVSIDVEVPGGITVWLVLLFALATYALVYRQYPSHQDWVGTVFSFVLPFLSRWLWNSD